VTGRLGILGLLTATGLLAQGLLSGPTAGFVYDPTRTVRQIQGMLGSANLGDPVLSDVDAAFVAPGRDYAIVLRGGQASLAKALGAVTQIEAPLFSDPAAASGIEGVVWSNDGSTAVIYSKQGNWVIAVTGLPDAPISGSQVDVSQLGSLSAVAAGLNRQIAVGVTGNAAGVYEIGGNGDTTQLAAASKPVAVAYGPDGTLYAFDAAASQLIAVNSNTGASRSTVLDSVDGIALQPGRAVVYVADRLGRRIVAYNSDTLEAVQSLALPIEPASIISLGSDSFLLNPLRGATDPLWVVSDATSPRLYFIPPAQSSLMSGGQ